MGIDDLTEYHERREMDNLTMFYGRKKRDELYSKLVQPLVALKAFHKLMIDSSEESIDKLLIEQDSFFNQRIPFRFNRRITYYEICYDRVHTTKLLRQIGSELITGT